VTDLTFTALGLAEPLQRALAGRGHAVPTPIQAGAIPHLLARRDLLGIAQTGTGKTGAFALPILHHLSQATERRASDDDATDCSGAGGADPGVRGLGRGRKRQGGRDSRPDRHRGGRHRAPTEPGRPRALVLAPTRELAIQIGEEFRAYGADLRLRQTVIFGGVSQHRQVTALDRGVDIVIATPGRLLDLLNQGHVLLDHVTHLVLDEADRMLDMGFVRDVRKIVAKLPRARQSLLFSATMPAEIARLSGELLDDPVRVEVTPQATPIERIDQSVHYVESGAKLRRLIDVLDDPSLSKVIVFTRTKHRANRVAQTLEKNRIPAEAIHGNKSQGARQRALKRFRDGDCRILVATDIAARGIDVEGITHVINFEIPNEPESYVHRVGRTARAGASGIAISFCDGTEVAYLRDIEKLIGCSLVKIGDAPAESAAPKRGNARQKSRGKSLGAQPGKSGNSSAAKKAGSPGGRGRSRRRPSPGGRNRLKQAA
jgi:ATP-dependent RNA helicase RhlE